MGARKSRDVHQKQKIAIRGPIRYIGKGVLLSTTTDVCRLVAAIAVLAVHRVVSATIAHFI